MNPKIIATGLVLASLLSASCGNAQTPNPTTAVAIATATAASTPAEAAGAATISATTTTTVTTEGTTTMSTPTKEATPKIVAAANTFLATLSDSEQATVQFDWTDTAQKQRWSNFPPAGFQRAGLMWGDLSEAQQQAWLAVMQATLSTEGYNRILAEWQADDALFAQEGTGGGFGTANYFIALIGTPSETTPWQWQFGGHHVTVNATVVGSKVVLTPSFIGCQPCSYTDAAGNTVRPLGDIEDEAFALVNALDAAQQGTAILGNTGIDLVLGPGQDGKTIPAEGLSAAQMNADQQAALLKLISHYAGLLNEEDAATRLAEIQSTLDQTYFAWYGPTTPGSAAYLRITGPTLVIEFAPQGGGRGSNSAVSTLHVHGIYRDPTNDYGTKLTQ